MVFCLIVEESPMLFGKRHFSHHKLSPHSVGKANYFLVLQFILGPIFTVLAFCLAELQQCSNTSRRRAIRHLMQIGTESICDSSFSNALSTRKTAFQNLLPQGITRSLFPQEMPPSSASGFICLVKRTHTVTGGQLQCVTG